MINSKMNDLKLTYMDACISRRGKTDKWLFAKKLINIGQDLQVILSMYEEA